MDIGYARHSYDDSGDCRGEAKLTPAYPLGDRFGVTGYVAYNPVSENFNRRATRAYEATSDPGFAGTYGYSDGYGTIAGTPAALTASMMPGPSG